MFGFKKKEEKKIDVPVQAVISMRERGLTNEQIIEQLKSQGYSLQAIRDALTQAEVKEKSIRPLEAMPQEPVAPPTPAPAPAPEIPQEPVPEAPVRGPPELTPELGTPTIKGVKIEEIEKILEEIVDERWKDVLNKFSQIEKSISQNQIKIEEVEKKYNELSTRVDNLSAAVMEKVDEYQKTMENVDIEIKALEKVMQKLVPNLAEQVKELKEIVGTIKKEQTLD